MKKAFWLAVLLLMPIFSYAANVDVNCALPGKAGSINATLGQLDPAGPNSVTIHGDCRENVVINGFDRLTFRGAAGSTLSDASGGTEWAVLLIQNSRRIRVRGLKISGGNVGVVCDDESLCDFANNTMDGQSQNGFSVNDSEAVFNGDTVRNTGGPGFFLNRSRAQLTGIKAESNGTGVGLNASTVVGENWTINSNRQAGVFVGVSSHLQLITSSVTNNAQNGIQATAVSTLSLSDDRVTGNTFSGVWLSDLSTVFFSGGTYENNAMPYGYQVECAPYYTVASNVPTGVSTNCIVH